MSPRLMSRSVVRIAPTLRDAWTRKQLRYLGDDNWPFRSALLPPPTRWISRKCARDSGKFAGAFWRSWCLRETISPFRSISLALTERGWKWNSIRHCCMSHEHNLAYSLLPPVMDMRLLPGKLILITVINYFARVSRCFW